MSRLADLPIQIGATSGEVQVKSKFPTLCEKCIAGRLSAPTACSLSYRDGIVAAFDAELLVWARLTTNTGAAMATG